MSCCCCWTLVTSVMVTPHSGKSSTLLLVVSVLVALLVGLQGGGGEATLVGKPKEEVCSSIDIRNSVAGFQKLENCTVIEGYLRVLLIDHAEPGEYANLSFPKLREITDYFLLFRVKNLKSLRTIFPNLAVIRGSEVFHNYAFVVYEMFELEEIGLRSLTDITRGGVRIEKNPRLCYVDSIDWDHIAKGTHFIKDNNEKRNECPNTCPEDCPTLASKGPLCWSQKDCQKKCDKSCGNSTCMDGKGDCCHQSCIGGCWNATLAACYVCRQFSFEERCTDTCPSNTFLYFGRRCLNANECKSMEYYNRELNTNVTYKPFQKKCERECPSDYHTDPRDNSSCVKCEKECPKECPGGSVTNIADAQKLKGCTIIKGDLEIQISGAHDVVSELQANLNMITEIQGRLKVIRSFPIMSLNFLSSLRKIEGKKDTKYEAENYALYVLDNQNLEELWNWNVRKSVLEISSGKLFFHFNPKLCIDKIRELERLTRLNVSDARDVSLTSNGDRTACKVKKLVLNVTRVNHEAAVIQFTNFLHLMEQKIDARSLLGYLINYKEAGDGNVSMFDDADACASESETWKVKDVNAAINNSVTTVSEIITNLKPFTRYAIYVKTYTVASEQFGGSSDIQYFSTAPTVPTPPVNVKAYSDAPDVLRVSWDPPTNPNGNITFYVIVGELEEYNENFIYSTDYCGDNKKPSEEPTATPESPKDGAPLVAVGGTNGTNGSSVSVGGRGEKCCACPKDKSQEDKEENEHMFRIQFENFLHNNVFVKRPPTSSAQPSSSLKRKRDISNEVNENPFNATTSPGNWAGRGSAATRGSGLEEPANSTAVKNDSQINSFVHISRETSVRVTKAKHFSSYTVKVRACQGQLKHKPDQEINVEEIVNNTLCSQESITTAKTAAAPGADNINVTTINVTVSTKSSGSVFVKWEAPADPNGLILKFDVETRRVDGNHYPTVTCVTYKKYLNGSGIDLTSLSAGNYSLRVSATTLWRSGEWSEPQHFYISDPPSTVTPAIIGGIVAAIIIFVIAIMLGAVVYVKKRERQLPDAMHYSSVNPEYLPAEDVYVVDEWEVPRDKIAILRELGQGSFGMVYEGEAKDIVEDKPVVRCAVKTVNATASHRERIEFLNEASVMKDFKCHHVVRLLGVVSMGQPTYVVMELMFHGDLKTYLRLHRPDEFPGKSPPSVKRILQMAIEISDGMAYLSDKKYVHRDLAARNCMVAEDLTVKIGDFGMTRDIYETDYYRKGGKGLLPVRWMAPESLKDGVFSSQSDVWSFGVVLWEMATLASQPYQGLSNEQVLKYVMDGGIMEKPENCLEKLYDLMRDCWSYNPKYRPTFMQLIERLLPNASASFSEVSFYQKYLDRDKGPPRDVAAAAPATTAAIATDPANAAEEEEDDDDDATTPSTPLRSKPQPQHRDSSALAVNYVAGGQDGEEARVEVGRSRQRTRARPQYQVVRPSAAANGGSGKDGKPTANGIVANGRAGAQLLPYQIPHPATRPAVGIAAIASAEPPLENHRSHRIGMNLGCGAASPRWKKDKFSRIYASDRTPEPPEIENERKTVSRQHILASVRKKNRRRRNSISEAFRLPRLPLLPQPLPFYRRHCYYHRYYYHHYYYYYY